MNTKAKIERKQIIFQGDKLEILEALIGEITAEKIISAIKENATDFTKQLDMTVIESVAATDGVTPQQFMLEAISKAVAGKMKIATGTTWKKSEAMNKVKTEMDKLMASNQPVTQTALFRGTGCNRQIVKDTMMRHKEVITAYCKERGFDLPELFASKSVSSDETE